MNFVFPSMDARAYGRSLHNCTGIDLSWQRRCNVSWMHLECLGAASQIHIIFLNRFSGNTVSFAALLQGSQIRGNGLCNLYNGDVMYHGCTLSAWVQPAKFALFF